MLQVNKRSGFVEKSVFLEQSQEIVWVQAVAEIGSFQQAVGQFLFFSMELDDLFFDTSLDHQAVDGHRM